MTSEAYDIVIVGGGINGAGVAQAAAAAGFKTLLLEKNDQPGLETSSSSSKLIHGGLRYLESLNLSLVRESLLERSLLLTLAPDLVKLQTFNIPIYKNTARSRLTLHAGLSLYALLSGLKKESFYHLVKENHWSDLDQLSVKNLKAVFQYQDAQTDDHALTLAVMSSAISLGAEFLCNAQVENAEIHPSSVSIHYHHSGHIKTVNSRVFINASGPWIYTMNQTIKPVPTMQKPELIQGTHLIMNAAVKQAYYLEAPQDQRAVFLMPWKGQSLLGTTEQLYQGDPSKVSPLKHEKEYLIEVLNHYFPTLDHSVTGDMAGCRVLTTTEKNPFNRSREIVLAVDNKTQPRVISMIGGKLTVYRRTAQKVMQLIGPSLPNKQAIADTAKTTLNPVERIC